MTLHCGIAISESIFHWSIVTSVGLYWGIATAFTCMEPGDSDSYGLCWDVYVLAPGVEFDRFVNPY